MSSIRWNRWKRNQPRASDAIPDSQFLQNGRVRFLHSENVMAGVAILPDDPTVGTLRSSIVAAEAAGKVRMPHMIRIGAPGIIPFRKYIAEINGRRLLDNGVQESALLGINFRIRGLLKPNQLRGKKFHRWRRASGLAIQ